MLLGFAAEHQMYPAKPSKSLPEWKLSKALMIYNFEIFETIRDGDSERVDMMNALASLLKICWRRMVELVEEDSTSWSRAAEDYEKGLRPAAREFIRLFAEYAGAAGAEFARDMVSELCRPVNRVQAQVNAEQQGTGIERHGPREQGRGPRAGPSSGPRRRHHRSPSDSPPRSRSPSPPAKPAGLTSNLEDALKKLGLEDLVAGSSSNRNTRATSNIATAGDDHSSTGGVAVDEPEYIPRHRRAEMARQRRMTRQDGPPRPAPSHTRSPSPNFRDRAGSARAVPRSSRHFGRSTRGRRL